MDRLKDVRFEQIRKMNEFGIMIDVNNRFERMSERANLRYRKAVETWLIHL